MHTLSQVQGPKKSSISSEQNFNPVKVSENSFDFKALDNLEATDKFSLSSYFQTTLNLDVPDD